MDRVKIYSKYDLTTNSKIRDCKYVLVNINLPTVFFECKINNFCIIFILNFYR